jgi:hypothetical protein
MRTRIADPSPSGDQQDGDGGKRGPIATHPHLHRPNDSNVSDSFRPAFGSPRLVLQRRSPGQLETGVQDAGKARFA